MNVATVGQTPLTKQGLMRRMLSSRRGWLSKSTLMGQTFSNLCPDVASVTAPRPLGVEPAPPAASARMFAGAQKSAGWTPRRGRLRRPGIGLSLRRPRRPGDLVYRRLLICRLVTRAGAGSPPPAAGRTVSRLALAVEQAHLAKAGMAALGDDQVVMQHDADPVQRLADLFCHLDVRLRRRRMVARMVVHHHQRRAVER